MSEPVLRFDEGATRKLSEMREALHKSLAEAGSLYACSCTQRRLEV